MITLRFLLAITKSTTNYEGTPSEIHVELVQNPLRDLLPNFERISGL